MLPLARITPPYDNVSTFASRDFSSVEHGDIVVLDIHDPGRIDFERLHRSIIRIRTVIDAALAIRLPQGHENAALRVAMHAYPFGVRAILVRDEPCRPALWQYLANPIDLPGDLVAWLRLHRRVSGGAADLIARIVREASQLDSLESVLVSLEIPPRTMRHQLAHEALPGPNKWYHLGRLLNAQIRLTRDPQLDITELAHCLGYADRLSFTNRISRLFGVTAETSRQLLGLEWRFAAWWKRMSASANPSRQHLAGRDFDSGPTTATLS